MLRELEREADLGLIHAIGQSSRSEYSSAVYDARLRAGNHRLHQRSFACFSSKRMVVTPAEQTQRAGANAHGRFAAECHGPIVL